jgi:hypothetical protein
MKIKFVGFSVTEYGDPPYPTRFAEVLKKVYPDAAVDYTAMGGLSIDSLPCLLRNVIPLRGYDLIIMEIATSWWSLLHEGDEAGTAHRVATLFQVLDDTNVPYCFLNLYRRDTDDNDVLVRAIRKEAGSHIPIIDLKARYRNQYQLTGQDDTIDGIHPNGAMVDVIATELMARVFDGASNAAATARWSAWRRADADESRSLLPLLTTGEPDQVLPTYTFDNRHGLSMSGYVLEQGKSVRIRFSRRIMARGLFFMYGPDTNYLKVEYDDVQLEVPMHDEMSFYRRLGYRELPLRPLDSLTITHLGEDRRKPTKREPWEKTSVLRNFVLGFSCEVVATAGTEQSEIYRSMPQRVYFYGASVTQQSKGNGYVDAVRDLMQQDSMVIRNLGMGGCHFNDAGYFNVEQVLEWKPTVCVLEWSTTGVGWVDDRKMNNVLAGLARIGCVPCLLVLPSKANTENVRRAESQLAGIAVAHGVPYLDLRHIARLAGTLRDDVHTTLEGAQRYAASIRPWLRDITRRHMSGEFRGLLERLATLCSFGVPSKQPWDGTTHYGTELRMPLKRIGSGPVSVAISTTVGVHSPLVDVVLEGGGIHHASTLSLWDRWSHYDRDLIRVLVDSQPKFPADATLELRVRVSTTAPDYQSCTREGIDFTGPKWFNINALHLEGAVVQQAHPSTSTEVAATVDKAKMIDLDLAQLSSDPNSIQHSFYLVNGQSSGRLELTDVTLVCGCGVPLDSTGQVINATVDEHLFWLPTTMPRYGYTDDRKKFSPAIITERLHFLNYYARELRTIAHRNGKANTLPDDAIYIDLTHPFGWYAFGHLHDSLQRLFNVRDLLSENQHKPLKFIVSDPFRVSDFLDHLQAVVGFRLAKGQVIQALKGHTYEIKRYIKPAMSSVYTNFTAQVFYWLHSQYASYFPLKDVSRVRLYLARNHVVPGSRGVKNEDELLPMLHEADFIIVKGNESLAEIHQLFSRAELVLGAHGSLFANTIFCPADCTVVEYCSNNRVDHSFRLKKKLTNNYEHRIVNGDVKFNIFIPKTEVQQILKVVSTRDTAY